MNLLRMGKRPNEREVRDSTGWYFSRPVRRAYRSGQTRREDNWVGVRTGDKAHATSGECEIRFGLNAPSTSAASKYGGQTTSPLPFIVFQHLRPVTIVWMVSLMPEEGETE